MNEIEIMQLPNGIDGLISELKPATKIKWNFELRKYEVDNSDEAIAKQQAGCELVKTALRDIYSFGETIARGTPKFCLALHRIFNNLQYVEDESGTGYSYHTELNVKPSMGVYGREGENFTKLVGRLGLSSSAAYRYKDLGNFVDEQTGEFYTEFKGYSLSLLSEIWTYAVESYNRTTRDLKALSKLIPADTTVVDIRAYRKIMKLKDKVKAPFDDFENRNKIDANKTRLPKVLKIYNELIQTAEAEKQKKELDSVQVQSEVIEYAGQLPGQTAMDLPEQTEQEEDNFSAYAEKSEPQDEPAPAPMTHDEIIKQSIKRGNGASDGKFKIVEYYNQYPLQAEFVERVRGQYYVNRYNAAWLKNIEVTWESFTIHRESGGKVVLPWSVVAGRISKLITAGEYLTEDEKERYLQWKAEKDGVTAASEPSEELEADEEFSAYAENQSVAELPPQRQQTTREYLATLSDDELINKLLIKILNVYHFRGESSQFLSTVRGHLKEWFNEPYEEI